MNALNKFFAIILMMSLVVGVAEAQKKKPLKNKDFKTKLKEASKEAKQYEKDGWYVAPGDIPLEKQLERSYNKSLEEDEMGYPKFVVAPGNAVAGTQSAAKMQSTELAKLEIANQMESQIAATIETQVANNQINAEEAATLQKTVAAAKNVIAQKMGRTVQLVEMYRKIEKTKKHRMCSPHSV
jgi:hypothetical protein